MDANLTSGLRRGLRAAARTGIILAALLGAGRVARAETLLVPPAVPAASPSVPKDAAGTAAPDGLSQAETATVLGVLADPAKRAQLADLLARLSKALPAPDTSKAVAAAPAPALTSDSLGIELLAQVSRWFADFAGQLRVLGQAVGGLPLLGHWLLNRVAAAGDRAAALDAAARLLAAVALALLAEYAATRLLRRPLRALASRHSDEPSAAGPEAVVPATPVPMPTPPPPSAARRLRWHGGAGTWRVLLRVPLALGRFVLDLLPVAVFLATVNLLLGSGLVDGVHLRLAMFVLVNAYVILRAVMCLARMLVAPDLAHLRLIPMGDASARYTVAWVRRLAIVAVVGAALAQIGAVYGLYPAAQAALIKLVALVDHLFLVVIVLQSRATVAARIRAPKAATGIWPTLLDRFARVWHIVAIFWIMAIWVVGAEGVQDGYLRLLHLFLVTLVVTVGARVVAIAALGALDRSFMASHGLADRYPGLEARATIYHPVLRRLVAGVILVLTGIALLEAWGFAAIRWLVDNPLGSRVISATGTVGVAQLLALLAWEGVNAAMNGELGRLTRDSQPARAARLRTLLPMVRTILLLTILAVLGLTVLSEIGVNVAPLLAGAGILGVAIGFGSQKLVQDFITGIFLLLENAMQVGDWITVAGLSGTVETLSIRTIRMRAGDGSVTIIPFSSVTTVNNTNRGLGNAAVTVSVAVDQDTDRVGQVLAEIALEMRADPEFKPRMLSELQLWGVDHVDATTATLTGQIVCTDSGRWAVQREFNRRLKRRFAELGIAIANPSQMVVLSINRDAGQRGGRQSPPPGVSALAPADPTRAPVPEAPQAGAG